MAIGRYGPAIVGSEVHVDIFFGTYAYEVYDYQDPYDPWYWNVTWYEDYGYSVNWNDSAYTVSDTGTSEGYPGPRTLSLPIAGDGVYDLVVDDAYGPSGTDRVTVRAGSATGLTIAGANDPLIADVVYGTAFADTIALGAGDDVAFGGEGADRASGGAGFDILNGQGGNDILSGDAGYDEIDGGAGADVLRGGGDGDMLTGGEGDDSLMGEDGFDWLFGGVGSDMLRGGAANDTLSGEAGDDNLLGDEGDDGMAGGAGADLLRGGAGNDRLYGADGVDRLIGEAGDDTAEGDAGDDVLFAGAGNDRLIGGAGMDTVDLSYATGATLTAFFAAGAGQIMGAGIDIEDIYGVEAVSGSAFKDTMIGGGGVEALYGREGGDILSGAGGADRLAGQDGNDRLIGGAGVDVLTGGLDSDSFEFDVAPGAENLDKITDFKSRTTPGFQSDLIALESSIFTFSARENQPLEASRLHVKGSSGMYGVFDTEDRIVYDPATGNLFYDPDGSGAAAAVIFAQLTNKPASLVAADFYII